jgi:hypothetical protein
MKKEPYIMMKARFISNIVPSFFSKIYFAKIGSIETIDEEALITKSKKIKYFYHKLIN